MLLLERWAQTNAEGQPVYVACYNHYSPFLVTSGRLDDWPQPLASVRGSSRSTHEFTLQGYYAISVNTLYEFNKPAFDRYGEPYLVDMRIMPFLRATCPDAHVGRSIRVFTADQIRRALAEHS